MDLGLRGRVALVSAASRGLGRASAEALAREGADVAICARGEESLRETEEALRALGVRVHAVVADVSTDEGCRAFVDGAFEALGRLDILVNNCGGPPGGPTEAFSSDDYVAAMDLAFMSAVRMTLAALPRMRANGWGRIVNITSYAAKQPIEGLALSNAARPAVVGFAKTLAREVAPAGITVNTVCPGPILTDRIRSLAEAGASAQGISFEEALGAFERDIPVGRIGRPDELGALVAFLAGEQAAFITGTTIQVDGGLVRSLL